MRRRIILTVVAACALGVVLLFLPAASAVRDREHRAEVAGLQRDAMVMASRLPSDPLVEAPDVIEAIFAEETDRARHFGLYDDRGMLVAGDGPVTGDDAVRVALTDVVADGTVGQDIVAAVPIDAADGRPAAVVRAEQEAARATGKIRTSILQLGAVALGALLVAAVAGVLLVRRLVRPLEALRAVAQRIGDGDFTLPTPVTGLSELDQLGDSLRSSANRIGRLLTRERAFSSDASHQLRTPLAALRTTLESELYAPRPDPRLAIEEGLDAVERLERTVVTLLDLARDEPPDRAELDVVRHLTDAADRWRADAARRGRDIVVTTAPAGAVGNAATVADGRGRVAAHASASACDHILDVLVENALVHGSGTVTLRAVPRHGVIGIEVIDEGRVPRDAEHRLFRRRESWAGSTGIGLHLARALAEGEGGRLRLATGEPTTFELLLRNSDAEVRTTGVA